MVLTYDEKEWRGFPFPTSLTSVQLFLHFKCLGFFPNRFSCHPSALPSFCLSLFHPLPTCLQNASAQTQQMLKGKTGTTQDAISILLKDH